MDPNIHQAIINNTTGPFFGNAVWILSENNISMLTLFAHPYQNDMWCLSFTSNKGEYDTWVTAHRNDWEPSFHANDLNIPHTPSRLLASLSAAEYPTPNTPIKPQASTSARGTFTNNPTPSRPLASSSAVEYPTPNTPTKPQASSSWGKLANYPPAAPAFAASPPFTALASATLDPTLDPTLNCQLDPSEDPTLLPYPEADILDGTLISRKRPNMSPRSKGKSKQRRLSQSRDSSLASDKMEQAQDGNHSPDIIPAPLQSQNIIHKKLVNLATMAANADATILSWLEDGLKEITELSGTITDIFWGDDMQHLYEQELSISVKETFGGNVPNLLKRLQFHCGQSEDKMNLLSMAWRVNLFCMVCLLDDPWVHAKAVELAEAEQKKGARGVRITISRSDRKSKVCAFEADLQDVHNYFKRKLIRDLCDQVYDIQREIENKKDWVKLIWLPRVRQAKALKRLLDVYGGVVFVFTGITPDFLKNFPIGYNIQGDELPDQVCPLSM